MRVEHSWLNTSSTGNRPLVFADALFEIVGVSGVIRTIGTAQDVDPEAHGFMLRCFSSFDRLRTNGVVGIVELQKPRNHALRQLALQRYLHMMPTARCCGDGCAFKIAHLSQFNNMVAGWMDNF